MGSPPCEKVKQAEAVVGGGGPPALAASRVPTGDCGGKLLVQRAAQSLVQLQEQVLGWLR
jgi:hypothetical protein